MLTLSNGITVMIDHIAWFSLRRSMPREGITVMQSKWLLQFGYAGGDKTFVPFDDEKEAREQYAFAKDAITKWVTQ